MKASTVTTTTTTSSQHHNSSALATTSNDSRVARCRKSYLNREYSSGNIGSLSILHSDVLKKIVGYLPLPYILGSGNTASKGIYKLFASALRTPGLVASMVANTPAKSRTILARQMREKHDYESMPLRMLQAAGADQAELEALEDKRARSQKGNPEETLLEWCGRGASRTDATEFQLALSQPNIDVNAGENTTGELLPRGGLQRAHTLEHLLDHNQVVRESGLNKIHALLQHSQVNPNFPSHDNLPIIIRGAHPLLGESGFHGEHQGSHTTLRSKIIDLLAKQPDIDVTAKTPKGKTVLHFCYRTELLPFFLSIPAVRAMVNAQDDKGNTALHKLARYNDVEGMKHLLNNGADRTIVNNDGKTAYDLAKMRFLPDHKRAMKLLKPQESKNVFSKFFGSK